MKNFVLCICCLLIFLTPACSKVKEKAEDAKGLLSTVKNLRSIQKNAVQMSASMDKAKKIELSEANLNDFYSNVKKLNAKHPDVDFSLAPTAAIALSLKGKNLKEIIASESSLNYDEYNAISAAIMKAMGNSVSLQMTETIYQQIKRSEKDLATQDLSQSPPQAKAQMQETLAKLHQQKLDLEAKMQEKDFRRIKKEWEMIEKARKNAEL